MTLSSPMVDLVANEERLGQENDVHAQVQLETGGRQGSS
jgi:hypothetical protein